MDLEIEGNTALVTASSSGLGKASATALARDGVDVVLNGRDEDRLADAVAEVDSEGSGDVIGVTADLTNGEDVANLVGRTVDEFGGLDHLVTSAGGPEPMTPLEPDDDDWYGTYDLLAMSVVRLVREASDHLAADGGGTVVNITSGTVKEASPSNVLSSSVRMSVIGLEKTLSKELAPEVRANAVLPGAHETPRIEEIFEASVERGEYDSYEAAREARAADIPLRRIGDPMELGNTVAFLSSPKSGYLNGVAIPISGGAHDSNL